MKQAGYIWGNLAGWLLLCAVCFLEASQVPHRVSSVNYSERLSAGVSIVREQFEPTTQFEVPPPPTPSGVSDTSQDERLIARAESSLDMNKARAKVPLDSRVGSNLRAGDDPAELELEQRQQSEPHIAADPNNSQILLATFQEGRRSDAGAASCGYAISKDGGYSWRRSLIPRLTNINGGRWFRATDPVAVVGADGTMYLNTLVARSVDFTLGDLVVSRSLDGGQTWSDPFVAYQGPNAQLFPDKNWMAVNPYAGTGTFNRLVITYTAFTYNAAGQTISHHLQSLLSSDKGATWSSPVSITPHGSANQGSIPIFLRDGSLVVIYFTFTAGSSVTGRIDCKRSMDGGQTWPVQERTALANITCYDDPDTRDGVFLPSASYAKDSDELYVAMTAMQLGQPRIVVVKSGNGGATWTTPIVVSDNPIGAGVMNPSIAASPDGKIVAVTFYDKRHAPGHAGFVDLYAALSFDGGASWQTNIRITNLSSDVRLAQPTSRGYMLGDYLGLTAGGLISGMQTFTAIWCDTREGESDPYTVKLAATPSGSYESWLATQLPPEHRSNATPQQDLDGDGLSLLHEWALGLEPLQHESGSPFLVQTNPGLFSIYYRCRMNNSLKVAWQKSGDGQSWHATDFTSRLEDMPPLVPDSVRLAGGSFTLASTERAWFRPVFMLVSDDGDAPTASTFNESVNVAARTRISNLSARGFVGTDDQRLIVGFVRNDTSVPVLLRGIGPSLQGYGVPTPITDPILTAYTDDGNRLIAENDNWMMVNVPHPPPPLLASLMNRVGAFPLTSGREAALLIDSQARVITSILRDAQDEKGNGLVEIYEAGETVKGTLSNLSARGFVDGQMIAGLVVAGPDPCHVLIRAVGPALASLGVPNVLLDPRLSVYRSDSSQPLAINDDWQKGVDARVIQSVAERCGAFPIAGATLDSALVLTLTPGAYTIVVDSARLNQKKGIALLEIYDAAH